METDDYIVKRIPKKARPYVVAAAGIVIQASTGWFYCFGNILPYLVSYLRWKVDPNQTTGSMIWLLSLMNGIPFAVLFGGYLERKIGARPTISIGIFLYTSMIALSYFSIQHSYRLLLVTLGFLQCFGSGVAYNAIMIQALRWFPGQAGMAAGLISAGCGLGGFFIAPIQTKFINPKNLPANKDGFFTQEELLEKVPSLFLLLAVLFAIVQIIALFFMAEPKIVDNSDREVLIEPENDEDNEKPNRNNQILTLKQVICSSTFKLFFFILMLNDIWCQITSGLFKAYGMHFIRDDFFLAATSAIASVTNCCTRVVWGISADNTSFRSSLIICNVIGAFFMWTLGLIKLSGSAYIYSVWICIMFSCIGGTYTLIPYALHKCFGGANFGYANGSLQLSLAFSGIAAPLLSQFMLPLIGYECLFLLAGSFFAISLILIFLINRTVLGKEDG